MKRDQIGRKFLMIDQQPKSHEFHSAASFVSSLSDGRQLKIKFKALRFITLLSQTKNFNLMIMIIAFKLFKI